MTTLPSAPVVRIRDPSLHLRPSDRGVLAVDRHDQGADPLCARGLGDNERRNQST